MDVSRLRFRGPSEDSSDLLGLPSERNMSRARVEGFGALPMDA